MGPTKPTVACRLEMGAGCTRGVGVSANRCGLAHRIQFEPAHHFNFISFCLPRQGAVAMCPGY
eukprot:scaffold17821_cov139-Isochrysis_galbana.AAC.6